MVGQSKSPVLTIHVRSTIAYVGIKPNEIAECPGASFTKRLGPADGTPVGLSARQLLEVSTRNHVNPHGPMCHRSRHGAIVVGPRHVVSRRLVDLRPSVRPATLLTELPDMNPEHGRPSDEGHQNSC